MADTKKVQFTVEIEWSGDASWQDIQRRLEGNMRAIRDYEEPTIYDDDGREIGQVVNAQIID